MKHFDPLPSQEDLDAAERREREEDRRRMWAIVWVIVAGPVCWALIYLGLKWAWGM